MTTFNGVIDINFLQRLQLALYEKCFGRQAGGCATVHSVVQSVVFFF